MSNGEAASKIKVFLAHGFGTEDFGTGWSETAIAETFASMLKRKGFQVVTGHKPTADRIDKKIKDRIDECDVILGIFTRRWKLQSYGGAEIKKAMFPPFVLSECSYALGSYQALDVPKLVGGFVEDLIDHDDLALVTVGGMEVLKFDRSQLNDRELLDRINEYIASIPAKLGRASRGDRIDDVAYRQQQVRKVVTVYHNGLGMVKTHYRVQIRDPESFNADGGRILHTLYTDMPRELPPFDEMCDTPLHQRFQKAFFAATLFSVNNKPPKQPVGIGFHRKQRQSVEFYLSFPKVSKKNTIIEYEYAWGMPNMFAAGAEELLGDYNEVSLRAFHGTIKEAILEVNFERGQRGTHQSSLYREDPFYQLAVQTSLNTPAFGKHRPLPKMTESIWDETFGWNGANFDGAVRISWQPAASQAH